MKNVETFAAIAERYENLDIPGFTPEARITTMLDLQVVGLDFPDADFKVLLNFPREDFCHDIFGIKEHINRRTAILEGCFVPRFVQA